MDFPTIFEQEIIENLQERLEKLDASTNSQWGKMDAGQMLAHLNVMYEMTYGSTHPKPNAFMKFILKMLVKKQVVGSKPYPKSSRTAPQFVITDDRDFIKEKARLIAYMQKSVDLGKHSFEQRESHSFGKLSSDEWNTMFYKHTDHHFRQFGV